MLSILGIFASIGVGIFGLLGPILHIIPGSVSYLTNASRGQLELNGAEIAEELLGKLPIGLVVLNFFSFLFMIIISCVACCGTCCNATPRVSLFYI